MNSTTLPLSTEVWVALITFIAGPLAASVAANLSLKAAVTALKEQMQNFEARLMRLESRRRRAGR